MGFIETDFTKEELGLIVYHALKLISEKALTGINLIHSNEKSLPKEKLLIHYLQDSTQQINHMKTKIKEYCPTSRHLILPRYAFYSFNPEYAKKDNFMQEYHNAVFFNSELSEISIGNIPNFCLEERLILANKEEELMIFNLADKQSIKLFKKLQDFEMDGPLPWIHPVMIIQDNGSLRSIKGYVRKDYIAIKRKHTEIYSIIPSRKSKDYLEEYIRNICKNLKTGKNTKIYQRSLLISKALINLQFNEYLKDSIKP